MVVGAFHVRFRGGGRRCDFLGEDMIVSNSLARRGVFILAILASVSLVFRNQIGGEFTFLFGDRFDGLIEVSILEHWFNVFKGCGEWSTINYFFPHKNTLAYNDGYFIYGIFYSIFRVFGADLLLASELVNVTFHAVGFIAFHAVCRRVFRMDFTWALAGASLFTIACNSLTQGNHAQLFTIALVPVQTLLLERAATAFREDRSRAAALWGAGAAALFGAWLMTAFYTAWFFAFFVVICCALYPLIAGRAAVLSVLGAVRGNIVAVLIIALVFVVCAAPFLWLYLPKAVETGMHSYGQFQPKITHILNVGPGNLIYGGIMERLGALAPSAFPQVGEFVVGVPPVTLACFLIGAVTCRRRGSEFRVLIAAIVVFWILTIDIGGVSLWRVVHALVPGAKAVRVVSRSHLFLTGPMIVVALLGLSDVLRGAVRLPAAAALVAVMLIEQVTVPPTFLNRSEETARLGALPPAPRECRAFAAVAAREGEAGAGNRTLELYSHNVDAMVIASVRKLPTINGFSTFNPPDWNFDDTLRPDYRARVAAYARARGVEGLCGLDLKNLVWSRDATVP